MVIAIIWKYDPKDKMSILDRILGGAITLFTGAPYTHVALYVKGNMYEDTIHNKGLRIESGALKTKGLYSGGNLVFLKLKQEVNEDLLAAFLDGTVEHSMNYSVGKLLLFILVYPFKKLWLKSGKAPFPYFKGQTCSVYADNGLEYAGVSKLVDNEIEEWETPRDFIDSKLFDTVDRNTIV